MSYEDCRYFGPLHLHASIRYRLLLALFGGILTILCAVGTRTKHERRHGHMAWEWAIMRAVKRAAPPADTALIRLPSWIGFGGFIPLDLLILSALAACKRSDTAWFFGIAVGGAAALRNLATFMVRRQRPSLWAKLGMERTRKASFPSGHAMGAMALAAALSSMAWPTGWRWPAALLSGSSVLLVGASRIVREEHYPSDILAGWAAALAWVRGCDAWVMRERREQRASR